MKPFISISAPAIVIPGDDIDTDIIFPARFLLLPDKQGLGRYAFHDRRPALVAGAQILVAGANFGCGSSREQAVWALADLGLRCIVAPSFGEIFAANCVVGGVLPLVLDAASHARVLAAALARQDITVDLRDCRVAFSDGSSLHFTVPAAQRQALLDGIDGIDLIRRDHGAAIAAFESAQRQRQPWLYQQD